MYWYGSQKGSTDTAWPLELLQIVLVISKEEAVVCALAPSWLLEGLYCSWQGRARVSFSLLWQTIEKLLLCGLPRSCGGSPRVRIH